MRKLIWMSLLAAGCLMAADSTEMVESAAPATVSVTALRQNPILNPAPVADVRLWRFSVASLAVANALDVHSSWGKHELNGALAGGNGTFGARGAALKLGMQGALLGVEYLLTRGRPHPRLYRVLSYVNFSAAGVIGVTAMHNYSIQRVGR